MARRPKTADELDDWIAMLYSYAFAQRSRSQRLRTFSVLPFHVELRTLVAVNIHEATFTHTVVI